MKKYNGQLVYSPSDLITYLSSPFSSWMDRMLLESPGVFVPDEEGEDLKLWAATGNRHEAEILDQFRASKSKVTEIARGDLRRAIGDTRQAVADEAPIIYQAALEMESFSGFADFLILDERDRYQVWDTKLARQPKPYYAIQLCCYSEMFASTTGLGMPEHFGIILGTAERMIFRVEDHVHYYRRVKNSFLAMQRSFTGELRDRPEPLPSADHGRWTSHAEAYLDESDHLFRVAGITSGQIKKLGKAGISTLTQLANSSGVSVPKLAADTMEKLVAQARLQKQTKDLRVSVPDAEAAFEILPQISTHKPTGLAAIPAADPADIFFDMEGYPVISGGLEYLFGATTIGPDGSYDFNSWWAHDRNQEKKAFEDFIDWAFGRWSRNPGLHIYHYAPYEVSAIRRLSIRHDTRQEEVDQLLRKNVFIDLYKVVREGIRLGEESYSIKKVERLYRGKRGTEVASGGDSIVQYALWRDSGERADPEASDILREIRDYNRDDCDSTAELVKWLRTEAQKNGIEAASSNETLMTSEPVEQTELSASAIERQRIASEFREKGEPVATVLGDLVDFHRREEKPMWWKMFEREVASPDELRDDNGCVEGIKAVGDPQLEKRSLVQTYHFDPSQECKLTAGDVVMFPFALEVKLTLTQLDLTAGVLSLKASQATLNKSFGGSFPSSGSLIPYERVRSESIQNALTSVAGSYLDGDLPVSAAGLLMRKAPVRELQRPGEDVVDAAVRAAAQMDGGCLVLQGPPGTGKTYTASRMIDSLLASGRRVGISSNSHKAMDNLLEECGKVARENGRSLVGVKARGDGESKLYRDNPELIYIPDNSAAFEAYSDGIAAGTAWLFTGSDWEGELDYLFVDEAGQVSLANAVAMSRAARNLVLLGDQMQLEQPLQGSHPGDAGLSALQYVLKDLTASKTDAPAFHAVVPADYGLFLAETRRMHPDICAFVSDSVYDSRLLSHASCGNQRIVAPPKGIIARESGVVFRAVEHEGNIQQSDEEIVEVVSVYEDLCGREYIDRDGRQRELELKDFLFIAPYNAQVRALEAALPEGARVGSVDRFQGQEAPVCILSLCSSFGEYGSRGLKFILDRNRMNVAISRAQCMTVVVADPRIAGASASSLEEMKLINMFCKLTGAN